MPEALPTGGSSHWHICGLKPYKMMCFSLNIPFKHLIFKCPLLLDPNYFNEQFLFLVASKLGATHGSVGSCWRKDVRSGLPGGALQARSHLTSWHLGFSAGCCSSGYSPPPCKGQWFLGSACVLVTIGARGFELHPRPDFVLGGETRLCFGGKAGWEKHSGSRWYLWYFLYLSSALTHCRQSWGWCTLWPRVPLLPWRKLLLKMFPAYILHFTDFTLNTLLFSPETPPP